MTPQLSCPDIETTCGTSFPLILNNFPTLKKLVLFIYTM